MDGSGRKAVACAHGVHDFLYPKALRPEGAFWCGDVGALGTALGDDGLYAEFQIEAIDFFRI